jgi:CheY-specific phosphatase CheX
MTTDTSLVTRSHEENWQPVLELSVEEVFEIMVGCRVKPVPAAENPPIRDFTAMVGLAGALCGILTVCCSNATACALAKAMLGSAAESEQQVGDALGEICNMITGNFKNKLAGTDEQCMLSVPTVVNGGQYNVHTMVEGTSMSTVVLFEAAPVTVTLQVNN